MADARALTRVIDELLWTLRRGGFAIATSQAVDVVRAAQAVGVEDRARLRDAVAAVIVERARERDTFDRLFDRFFSAAGAPERATLWDRLAAAGFAPGELDALRELLADIARVARGEGAPLGALLERGADLDRLLALSGSAGSSRDAGEPRSRLQLGFYTHRLLQRMGLPRAHDQLAALRAQLRDALGEARGDALVDALKRELDATGDAVRDHVIEAFERRAQREQDDARGRTLDTTPFTSLSDAEIDEVRRAVRRFADRLRGGEQVRRRRALRGSIDPHRTFRRMLATGGVPFSPARRRHRREKPRLVLLCDISDSVRSVACFMLEFVYAAQELFARTRSFVFVSELGETTALFDREGPTAALGRAYGGGVVSVHDNSNYGRVLRAFEAEHLGAVDRRTTVVVLGDGRTNYHDDAAPVLDRIRERARALLWLCPEGRGEWSLGDSAMPRYAPKCTEVFEVRSARDLEDAARAIVARR
jgi:uncharacterized protein with von Willebrand factor type A (vWA) domain